MLATQPHIVLLALSAFERSAFYLSLMLICEVTVAYVQKFQLRLASYDGTNLAYTLFLSFGKLFSFIDDC